MRQADIINETINRIQQAAGARETDSEGVTTASEGTVSFKRVIYPIFKSIVDLDLVEPTEEGTPSLLDRITNEDFIKKVVSGKTNFFEQALRDESEPENLLATILKGRLDQKDQRFKDLAEKLVEKLNSEQYNIHNTDSGVAIYQALNLSQSPLSTEFKPKNLS